MFNRYFLLYIQYEKIELEEINISTNAIFIQVHAKWWIVFLI